MSRISSINSETTQFAKWVKDQTRFLVEGEEYTLTGRVANSVTGKAARSQYELIPIKDPSFNNTRWVPYNQLTVIDDTLYQREDDD